MVVAGGTIRQWGFMSNCNIHKGAAVIGAITTSPS